MIGQCFNLSYKISDFSVTMPCQHVTPWHRALYLCQLSACFKFVIEKKQYPFLCSYPWHKPYIQMTSKTVLTLVLDDYFIIMLMKKQWYSSKLFSQFLCFQKMISQIDFLLISFMITCFFIVYYVTHNLTLSNFDPKFVIYRVSQPTKVIVFNSKSWQG